MYNYFEINEKLQSAEQKAMELCKEKFEEIEKNTEYNQQKLLASFIKNGVGEAHFSGTTGYGYNDRGRDTIEQVFADAVGAESSIFRHNFVSGTHTLTVALFGVLRPGDKVLCLTGRPYDTLIGVIGLDEKTDGSLKDFGVDFEVVDLLPNGEIDFDACAEKLKSNKYKMAYIQRSRGYELRPSLTIEIIEKLCSLVKTISNETITMVDNCYGEFVQQTEPTQVGADLMAGSLIKNAGGGIAPTGGYIAGKKELVESCGYRLTAPGVGLEIGATLGLLRELYMGLFNAPHCTGEALKTAVFASALFEILGYGATPDCRETRADIIQTIMTGEEGSLIAFCKGLQSGSPVDSFVTPEPWDMPGYDSPVIMAAGAFTMGASIELSADAPLREPFAVWLQGGLNFHSAKVGIMLAAQKMFEEGFIK